MANPEILTRRLKLAALRECDAPTYYGYRSDPAVSRFQMSAPGSPEEALKLLRGRESVSFDTPGTWFQFGIRLRESDVLVGDLGVRFPANDARQVEIGFTVAPAHQRKGYGTEAVKAVLGHVFGVLGKHRVFASVDPRNEASIALLRRVGMRQEAHFRESFWLRGEWVDDLVFAILQSEWNSR